MDKFTDDEQVLLTLYYTGERAATIRTLQEMHTWLQADEKYLLTLTEELIRKLTHMTDAAFTALDIFVNIPV